MKRIALAVAIAASALSIAAYDFSGSGFTQKSERTEGGKSIAILTDESGGEVLFSAEAEPSSQRISVLRALVAELRSWSNLQIAEIRAVNRKDQLQVTVIPLSFTVDGVALGQAVPGGIQLLYKTATEYDFKVKSGKYVVHVSSVFTSEAELEAAALAAYKDPAAFIATRDPLFVQKRLDELAAQASDFAAKADDLAARLAAVEAVTFDVSNGAKEERTSKAENEIVKLKTLLLAALNGAKPIKPEAVAKLVDLKKADPSLDKKTAPKALKAAGFSLSASEISAIFLVEFGEY
ncbi:MAG: hypothetical protein ABSF43_00220 [Rectinemataceae bacterium]|jgi:hypothetical protein